jgi:ketopantoate reductase
MSHYNILILGASYGSLLASKMMFGGHNVKLVCLPAEADLINSEGFRVRMPIRGRKDQIEIDSRKLPGKVSAAGPADVNPKDYDLIGLAMQEPQYGSAGVRELLDAVAKSRVPCMSIMNMPPLPYVRRIPNLNGDALKAAYTDPSVWNSFDPGTLTLCSPDPQAIRPPEERVNVLQVTLPTNFKVARFDDEKSTAILRQLEKDIDAVRFDTPEGKIELPVKLRVHDSLFVPLAKWAMLLAGNYRCITADGMRTAQEAVHSNIEEARSVYNFVVDLCVKLGATREELVPFEKYAAAAESLSRPASAARALNNGALNIERADKLVQLIAKEKGLSHPVIDSIVALVDRRLEANRAKAKNAA